MRVALGLTLWIITGCSTAPQPAFERSPIRLPAARLPDDSVVVDIGFVRLPNDEVFLKAMWDELDEQALPDLRRRMANNGIRAGVISTNLPEKLRCLMDQRCDEHEHTEGPVLTPVALDSDLDDQNRRLHLREGKRGEIVTAGTRERIVVLQQQERQVSGMTYQDAQTQFSMTADARGDGGARIELVPEVQHGQSRSRFVGREGAFRLEASREREVFDRLRLVADLAVGQTLAVTCTRRDKSLGGAFFSVPDSDTGERKMLLIRLAQSPGRDLFDQPDE